jgi:hypothetical protein
MRFKGFIGDTYTLESRNVDSQDCINLYPKLHERGTGKEQEVASLWGTPGYRFLVNLGSGPIRGTKRASNNQLFVVCGNKLYRVSSNFVQTELGTLSTSSGKVSMDDNGIQLVIVDGENGYVLTLATSSFLPISDTDFPGADQVIFQDGYFIFSRPNSGQFFISGLNAVTFDALDVASVEGSPDNLVGHINNNRDVFFFGEKSAEVFYNSGNADQPFERIQGAFLEVGLAARWSLAKSSSAIFWLGCDEHGTGIVYSAQGYQPRRISTHAVEQAIQSYSTISDAEAWTYQMNGHFFYVLNFPTGNATWVYDAKTELWHKRGHLHLGQLNRHRASCHAFAFGKHIIGDYENGNLYELGNDIYSDNGAPILRRRRSPHISAAGKNIFYDRFELDLETGVGLDGTQHGTDPKVVLRFSDDNGHSWSNEKWMDIGKIGQTTKRAIRRKLGYARDRVWEVTITDPVKVVITGANFEIRNGAA